MKTLKRVLKIRHIESADTGVYTCRGVNGFGSATVRAEIIVKGSAFLKLLLNSHRLLFIPSKNG